MHACVCGVDRIIILHAFKKRNHFVTSLSLKFLDAKVMFCQKNSLTKEAGQEDCILLTIFLFILLHERN